MAKKDTKQIKQAHDFVAAFRQSAPYIHAHRGKTFVLAFSGDAVAEEQLPLLVPLIALLNSVRDPLVCVPGARPQFEQQLKQRNVK